MMIQVNQLVKRYKDVIALDHFNMEVKEGEILGLLGPNGSGKTTAINCMLSLLEYDKGTIQLFGKEMNPDALESKQMIGIIPQEVAVFFELTVYENIDYFCSLYVKDKATRKRLVEEAIAFVSLQEYRKFRPGKLSGGLLRRLNIACGIAHQPKLIFMDEPTVAVDPQSRNSILEGIRKLNEQGATIVYTSHYMEEVEEICSRIIIMDKGKVIAQGSKEQLKASIMLKERVDIEQITLSEKQIVQIKEIANVFTVQYHSNHLTVKFMEGKHNLINLLDYFAQHDITFGKVYTQLPTLNDVFLEITGKQLRD
ncbi:ATP-binding cassette domain-containing protein [[Eubacterium] hominis]|uniref:ABC transporter ATP-binding protein n=1 Tax=[Eubacterium] hominis TaxID=2764325 RepID=UPI003A4D5976